MYECRHCGTSLPRNFCLQNQWKRFLLTAPCALPTTDCRVASFKQDLRHTSLGHLCMGETDWAKLPYQKQNWRLWSRNWGVWTELVVPMGIVSIHMWFQILLIFVNKLASSSSSSLSSSSFYPFSCPTLMVWMSEFMFQPTRWKAKPPSLAQTWTDWRVLKMDRDMQTNNGNPLMAQSVTQNWNERNLFAKINTKIAWILNAPFSQLGKKQGGGGGGYNTHLPKFHECIAWHIKVQNIHFLASFTAASWIFPGVECFFIHWLPWILPFLFSIQPSCVSTAIFSARRTV